MVFGAYPHCRTRRNSTYHCFTIAILVDARCIQLPPSQASERFKERVA